MPDEPHRLDLIQRYAEQLDIADIKIGGVEAASDAALPLHPQLLGIVDPPPISASAAHRITIDLDRLERLGCIRSEGGKKTELVEQFQIIKRPLIQKALATGGGAIRNGNAIMVTSAKPGEGKSFVAINLALSIASEHDLHVMLLDGDFFHQSLPAMLGVTVERGLVDLLLDERLDIGDVLLSTNVDKLTILPAGRGRSHSTELLSSQRMRLLMQEAVSRYTDRLIIIDSPPVLASTETGVLASLVGQIVMVVEQNRTGSRLVERSLAKLRDCAELSFVLNKVEPLWEENFAGSYR
jgi:exopolysaccharide/PEP-CTERM locus tyrosine autokinase